MPSNDPSDRTAAMLQPRTSPSEAHLRLRRRRNLGKLFRASALVGTFALSAAANHEVGLDPWESVFAGLQSFTLGLDTSPPVEEMAKGGLWPALVWFTRFLAPFLAMESVLFAALLSGLIGRPRFLLVDHVVVIGAGNLGRTVAENLIDRDGSDGTMLDVVVVDVDPRAPNLKELAEQGAWTVVGDGTLPGVLHQARVETARAVVIATSSDVANVAAMWNCRARCAPGAHIYVHVTDEHLRGTVTRLLASSAHREEEGAETEVEAVREANGRWPSAARPWRPSRGRVLGAEVDVFNLYDEAGRLLVAREGLDGPSTASVVIAGFGRLGRAIHRHLGSARRLVVDRNPEALASLPIEQRRSGSVDSREVMEAIGSFLEDGSDAVVFVATDQDVRNLDLALGLQDRLAAMGHRARLVTRMFACPGGQTEVLERIGATSLAQVVATSDRFQAIAAPPPRTARARVVRWIALVSWWTGAV